MVFYDFEVFCKDWLVVLLEDNEQETHIHNDTEALRAYVDAHRSEVWTGYNSLDYDRWILAAILVGHDNKFVKKLNDALINGEGTPWDRCRSAKIKTAGLNLDAVPQYDGIFTINNKPIALKTAEGYAGVSIVESSVDFNLRRALTPEEVDETFHYCSYDVAQTKAIFDAETHSGYETRRYFIEKYNFPSARYSKTIAGLAEEILEGNGRGGGREAAGLFQLPKTLKLTKYKYIQDIRESPFGREIVEDSHNLANDITETIAGLTHVLGSGGIHSEREGVYHHEGKILSLDITACYPSLMDRYGIARRVIDRWDRFLEIHRANIDFKRQGNKAARQPYKILDNSISGKLKAPFSALYDPQSNNEICQGGIFFIVDLLEHIETGAPDVVELIQSNTDGLYYALLQPDKLPEVLQIVDEWQERTGLSMDAETFDGVIHQKDVNNYFIADKSGKIIKSKGEIKTQSTYDYNLPIINRALKAYLINGVKPEEVVNSCDDLREFQLVAHVGKDSKLRTGDNELKLKTVRVFASLDATAGGLEERRLDKKTGAYKWIKYSKSPEHVFFDNGDVRGKVPPPELDRDWYIAKIYERLIDWTGEVLRDEDRDTKKGRKALRDAAKAQEDSCAGAGNTSSKGKKTTRPSATELLDLSVQKKLFDDYSREEVTAGALRRLKAEYLDPNGLTLDGSKWSGGDFGMNRKKNKLVPRWILRIRARDDTKTYERALMLTIHFDEIKNAVLVDPRVDLRAPVWKWDIRNDPDFRLQRGDLAADRREGCETISQSDVDSMISNEVERRRKGKESTQAAQEEQARIYSDLLKEYESARPLREVTTRSYGVQYLKGKGVLEYAQQVDPELKIAAVSHNLLVPFYYAKKLVSIQRIGTGYKGWVAGTHPRGIAAHVIRGKTLSLVAICEGLATGLSVHRRYKGVATVLVTGDASSLAKFGARYLNLYPNLDMIVAADNDIKEGSTKNTGMEAAKVVESEHLRLIETGRRKKDAFFAIDYAE